MKRSLGTATLEVSGAGSRLPVHLALSPQCGFASVAAGNEISGGDQRRKLALLGDTARKVRATS